MFETPSAFLIPNASILVHIHADESISQSLLHTAAKLQGVLERLLAVSQAIVDAGLKVFRDFQATRLTQILTDGVGSKRQRQRGPLVPPGAKIHQLDETAGAEGELSFMDDKSSIRLAAFDRVEDSLEGNRHGLKLIQVQPQYEESRRESTGNGNSLTAEFGEIEPGLRYRDRPVVSSDAGAMR